jgi:hypothetical protein
MRKCRLARQEMKFHVLLGILVGYSQWPGFRFAEWRRTAREWLRIEDIPVLGPIFAAAIPIPPKQTITVCDSHDVMGANQGQSQTSSNKRKQAQARL